MTRSSFAPHPVQASAALRMLPPMGPAKRSIRDSPSLSLSSSSEHSDSDLEPSLVVLSKPKKNPCPGRRIIGRRVYDSTLGITCHWCRQKTVEDHVFCHLCTIAFCGGCLKNRHGELIHLEMQKDVSWVCPRCRGGCGYGCENCCNCGPCRKAQGLEPTGLLVHTARASGFDNVHDYLIFLKTGESSEMLAKRKHGRGWCQTAELGVEEGKNLEHGRSDGDLEVPLKKQKSHVSREQVESGLVHATPIFQPKVLLKAPTDGTLQQATIRRHVPAEPLEPAFSVSSQSSSPFKKVKQEPVEVPSSVDMPEMQVKSETIIRDEAASANFSLVMVKEEPVIEFSDSCLPHAPIHSSPLQMETKEVAECERIPGNIVVKKEKEEVVELLAEDWDQLASVEALDGHLTAPHTDILHQEKPAVVSSSAPVLLVDCSIQEMRNVKEELLDWSPSQVHGCPNSLPLENTPPPLLKSMSAPFSRSETDSVWNRFSSEFSLPASDVDFMVYKQGAFEIPDFDPKCTCGCGEKACYEDNFFLSKVRRSLQAAFQAEEEGTCTHAVGKVGICENALHVSSVKQESLDLSLEEMPRLQPKALFELRKVKEEDSFVLNQAPMPCHRNDGSSPSKVIKEAFSGVKVESFNNGGKFVSHLANHITAEGKTKNDNVSQTGQQVPETIKTELESHMHPWATSSFKRELEAKLLEPFSSEELEKLSIDVNSRKPVYKTRETRHGSSLFVLHEEGYSYLDHHPDLDFKLQSTNNPETKLSLLRGFFFWIQHASMKGAYKPWIVSSTSMSGNGDDECVEVDGPDCEILAVVCSLDEEQTPTGQQKS